MKPLRFKPTQIVFMGANHLNSRGQLRQDSQCAKIIARLRAAIRRGEEWVTMPQLVEASGSYNIHTRVNELRKVLGFDIENKTDTSVRPHVSKYRLLETDASVRGGVETPSANQGRGQ
jgi:hypothetical protein